MTNVEKIKEIFENYYQRDEIGIEAHKAFVQEQGQLHMKKILDSVPELEERFGVTLPETYKAFLEAGAGIGMSTMDNCDKFYAFDRDIILDWNMMGSVHACVADSFEDVFVFGADYCDCCYFIDVKDKFGFGKESVWKSYRSGFEQIDLELVGNDFIEFLENFANNKELKTEKPFKPYKPTVEDGEAIVKIIEERARADEKVYQEILEAEKKIDEYVASAKSKVAVAEKDDCDKEDFDIYGNMIIEPFKSKYFDKYPIKSLAIFIYLGFFEVRNNYGYFFKNYEMNGYYQNLSTKNKELFEYFRFIDNITPMFISNDGLNYHDCIFQDYQNKLGRGTEAIYIIHDDGRPMEEACYIATDIVDFIRKICENEPFDLTPIGETKKLPY